MWAVLWIAGLSGCGSHRLAIDADGDGFSVDQGDCGDLDAAIFPGAPEVWYDGTDQNCDGNDGDQDGDGWYLVGYTELSGMGVPEGYGEGDCLDDSAIPGAYAVFPGASDPPYDGVDADCLGDDDNDADHDGFPSEAFGGDDCFDGGADDFLNPAGLPPEAVYPQAVDAPYDGTDADCAGNDDFDADVDGFPKEMDCDDADASRAPDQQEEWYDGIDQDCDGNDGDQDGDGLYIQDYSVFSGEELPDGWSGGDCADDPSVLLPAVEGYPDLPSAAVFPGALDLPYDGIDADCAGNDDFDADQDGWSQGLDCDDGSNTRNPAAAEQCNALDDDCSGIPDDHDPCPCPVFHRGTVPYFGCGTGDQSLLAASCAAFGYQPLRINDAGEGDWLVLQGLQGWLGVSDLLIEGSFVDSENNPLVYSNWASGQPDNADGREDCVLLREDGTWEDAECSRISQLLCEGS